jgi:hypothetical protein
MGTYRRVPPSSEAGTLVGVLGDMTVGAQVFYFRGHSTRRWTFFSEVQVAGFRVLQYQ